MLRVRYQRAVGVPVSWGWGDIGRIGGAGALNPVFRGRLWVDGAGRCPETTIEFIMTIVHPLPLLLAACAHPATTAELVERLSTETDGRLGTGLS
jgi:hypothetical protein